MKAGRGPRSGGLGAPVGTEAARSATAIVTAPSCACPTSLFANPLRSGPKIGGYIANVERPIPNPAHLAGPAAAGHFFSHSMRFKSVSIAYTPFVAAINASDRNPR